MIAWCMRYCTVSRRAMSRPIMVDQPLEEADAETFGRRLLADDRRRQLAMIAGQHQAVAAQERNPAARLGALAGLVDHDQIEPPRAEQLAIEAGRRGADHGGRIRECSRPPAAPAAGRRPAAIGRPRAAASARPASARRARCLPASRNRLIACLTSLRASRTSRCSSTSRSSVCSRSSGSTRAGWPSRTARSPNANSRSKDVIDGQVARRAGQHLLAAADRLADHLDDGRRLAGAGRAVDQAHVAGGQGELHGVDLRSR